MSEIIPGVALAFTLANERAETPGARVPIDIDNLSSYVVGALPNVEQLSTANLVVGQVLQSDGDGTLSFVTPSGGATEYDATYNTTIRSNFATAGGINGVSLGLSANIGGSFGVAVGSNSVATGNNATAVGGQSQAVGIDSISIGGGVANAPKAVTIGKGVNNAIGATSGVGIGSYSVVNGIYSVAFGAYATAEGYGAVAIGESAYGGIKSVVVGQQSIASGEKAIAVGQSTSAVGIGGVALGYLASAPSKYDVSIGWGSYAANSPQGYNVSIGWYCNTKTNGIAIGRQANTALSVGGIAIGFNSQATGNSTYNIAIGYSTSSQGGGAIAFGNNTTANGLNAVAIGTNINNVIPNSIRMGWANTAGNYIQMADFNPNVGVKSATHSIPVTLNGTTYHILLSNV